MLQKQNMYFPVEILQPALCNVNVFFFMFKPFVVLQIYNEFILSIKSVRFNKERYLSSNNLSAFYRPWNVLLHQLDGFGPVCLVNRKRFVSCMERNGSF